MITDFLLFYALAGCVVALVVLWLHQADDIGGVLLMGAGILWPLYVIKWIGFGIFYALSFILLAVMTAYDDIVHSGRG